MGKAPDTSVLLRAVLRTQAAVPKPASSVAPPATPTPIVTPASVETTAPIPASASGADETTFAGVPIVELPPPAQFRAQCPPDGQAVPFQAKDLGFDAGDAVRIDAASGTVAFDGPGTNAAYQLVWGFVPGCQYSLVVRERVATNAAGKPTGKKPALAAPPSEYLQCPGRLTACVFTSC